MENLHLYKDKSFQPEESEFIKYVPISQAEIDETFKVAVAMIENGQTKFIIEPNPTKSPDIT